MREYAREDDRLAEPRSLGEDDSGRVTVADVNMSAGLLPLAACAAAQSSASWRLKAASGPP